MPRTLAGSPEVGSVLPRIVGVPASAWMFIPRGGAVLVVARLLFGVRLTVFEIGHSSLFVFTRAFAVNDVSCIY